MPLDDAVGERQAEARALADFLRREEGIEDAALDLEAGCRAIVLELEPHSVVDGSGLEIVIVAALLERIACVHQQIQEDLVQLARVAAHLWDVSVVSFDPILFLSRGSISASVRSISSWMSTS